MIKFSRLAFDQGVCSEQEYYEQFLSDKVIDKVFYQIGIRSLLNSKSENFEDVEGWEDLARQIYLYNYDYDVLYSHFYSACELVTIERIIPVLKYTGKWLIRKR